MINRPSDNRAYLRDVVIPHLMEMPTIEDYVASPDEFTKKYGDEAAFLDFDTYADGRTDCLITDKYNCGRVGCLAGWYFMMSGQDRRLSPEELKFIDDYSESRLADHFGIKRKEADLLFGTKSHGLKRNESDDTREILQARIEYLNTLIKEYIFLA